MQQWVTGRISNVAIAEIMRDLSDRLRNGSSAWSLKDYNDTIDAVCQSRNIKVKDIYMPARYLLTGTNVGAAVPETMVVLGVEEMLQRLDAGLQHETTRD